MHAQLCGDEGHNKRTCPLAQAEAPPREKRPRAPLYPRPEGAPVYRGVTWAAQNGLWRAQAWDGQRVRHPIDGPWLFLPVAPMQLICCHLFDGCRGPFLQNS